MALFPEIPGVFVGGADCHNEKSTTTTLPPFVFSNAPSENENSSSRHFFFCFCVFVVFFDHVFRKGIYSKYPGTIATSKVKFSHKL